ncbi:MAG TPA: hypothetical protein ENN65_05490 [Candidatus Hydrogenedentes bacterium]|nr:hypothetical protein [Candidatus Hydrogenedentota bacterium]
MYRFFLELWCISIVLLTSSATAFSQTAQWVAAMPGPPLSPTLYPDAQRPSGVIVAAGAALMRMDADGALTALFATQNPNAVHALTWGAGGHVGWASLRGDSGLTGRGNAPQGAPGAAPLTPAAPLRL